MGACASKFKDFKDDALAPEEKYVKIEEDVKLVEETVNKEEEKECEGKSCSFGNLLKEVEGEKGSVDDAKNVVEASEEVKKEDARPQENGNTKSPEPVADAEPNDETEKAPSTQDLNKADEEKPASEDVQVKACDVKTEEEPLAETENIETLEKCEEQQTGSDEEKKKLEENPIVTTKLETLETKDVAEKKGNEENKLAENTKIETPSKEEAAEIKIDENKPVSDPENGEEKTKN